jgi:hypothetical protein
MADHITQDLELLADFILHMPVVGMEVPPPQLTEHVLPMLLALNHRRK